MRSRRPKPKKGYQGQVFLHLGAEWDQCWRAPCNTVTAAISAKEQEHPPSLFGEAFPGILGTEEPGLLALCGTDPFPLHTA